MFAAAVRGRGGAGSASTRARRERRWWTRKPRLLRTRGAPPAPPRPRLAVAGGVLIARRRERDAFTTSRCCAERGREVGAPRVRKRRDRLVQSLRPRRARVEAETSRPRSALRRRDRAKAPQRRGVSRSAP